MPRLFKFRNLCMVTVLLAIALTIYAFINEIRFYDYHRNHSPTSELIAPQDDGKRNYRAGIADKLAKSKSIGNAVHLCLKIDNKGTQLSLPAELGSLIVEALRLFSGNASLLVLDAAVLQCFHNNTKCCHVYKPNGYFHLGIWEDLQRQMPNLPEKILRDFKSKKYTRLWKTKDMQILISALETREDYWYIPGVDELGLPAMAFRKFKYTRLPFVAYKVWNESSLQLDPLELDGEVRLFIPNDIEFHLWIFEHSRFVECNKTNIAQFYAQYPEEKKAMHEVALKDLRAAAEYTDFLLQHHIVPMLCGGSLLGWYRQCDTISYSRDIDLMYLFDQYSDTLLNDLSCHKDYWVVHVTGYINSSLEISVLRGMLMMDLFTLYPAGNDTVYLSSVTFNTYAKFQEIYPAIPRIVAVDLHGYLFFAPYNAFEIIWAVYEDTWMKKIKEFSYIKHPKNLRTNGHYTKSEWKMVHHSNVTCNKTFI